MQNIRDKISLLCKKSDMEVYMDYMDKDISAHRLPVEKKKEIIEKSIEVATKFYEKLQADFGDLSVVEYARKLSIPINYVEEKGNKYFTYLGLFKEKTQTIVVNFETVLLIKRIGKQFNLDNLVNLNMIKDAVIAHEMFHYFELVNPDIYTNQKIIDAKIFGIIKTKSRLLAAGEIAAMHFSKLLTKLNHTTLVYDKIFAYGRKLVA